MGTLKSRFNETVFLSTQNICFRLLGKKLITILGSKTLLNWSHGDRQSCQCRTHVTSSDIQCFIEVKKGNVKVYNFISICFTIWGIFSEKQK